MAEITPEQYKQIQRYLNDEMNSEEEKAFENELDTDNSLRENYDFEINLRDYLETKELEKEIPGFSIKEIQEEIIKAKPAQIEFTAKKIELTKPKTIQLKRWIIYAAAACIIFAIAGIIWVNIHNKKPIEPSLVNNPPSHDTLKSQKTDTSSNIAYNKPDTITGKKDVTSEKSKRYKSMGLKYFIKDELPEDTPEVLKQPLIAYAEGKPEAIEKIDLNSSTLHQDDTRGPSSYSNTKQGIQEIGRYYKGIAFLESQNYKQAQINLKWVSDSSAMPHYKVKAKWYLALIFLIEEHEPEAKQLLDEVEGNTIDSNYSKKATDLLKELKKD